MKPPQDTLAEDQPDVRADGRGLDEHVSWHDSRPEPRRGIAGKFREQPVLNTLLAVLCIAAIVLAAMAIGPASPSGGQSTRTATVNRGVVQSTVSGSGNIQSASQLNLGFKTSGTVTHIYVKEGQHVTQGQLLATLDPGSAEVSLEQAKATLQSAEANLAKLEETKGETTGSQGASTGSGATASTAGASTATTASTRYVAYAANTSASIPTGSAPSSTTPGPTTTGTSTKPTSTRTTTTKSTSPSSSKSGSTTHPVNTSEAGTSSSQSAGATQGASSPSSKQSAATREANLASARAAVKSDKLSVQSAEQAVQNTKLYAPESGTIVSLSGEVGETVSGTGTTKASPSSTSGSSTSGSSGTGAGGKSGLGGGSTASSSSSSSSQGGSSSSSFAVLSDLQSLQLVVALSESEINNVHVGQIATVTIEALAGRKVGAHVVSVGQVPTSSSGAVSYDVTFQLDQEAEGLRVGMSATAEVVVQQEEGLNVPTSAIKAGSVTVLHNGKQEARRVTTGLAGDSSTIILSGLKAGEVVALPTTTSSGSSLSSRLGSRLRSGGLGGGGGGFVGAGAFPGGGPPGS
jgi:multidrug efflux pump subunit AcrA (membrane-fusion protein)